MNFVMKRFERTIEHQSCGACDDWGADTSARSGRCAVYGSGAGRV